MSCKIVFNIHFASPSLSQLEKLLGEIVACLQHNYPGAYDSELLGQLSPLLCIIFLHKNKQIRKQSALLWNATFAKATTLIYPEELKYVSIATSYTCLIHYDYVNLSLGTSTTCAV